MTQYGLVTNPSTATVAYVQSNEPGDLQARLTALIASLPLDNVITNITLLGAGDGGTFVVEVEYAPAAPTPPDGTFNVTGGLTSFGGAALAVRCFWAGHSVALASARAAVAVPAGFSVVDEQVAGASQGTAMMGLVIALLDAAPIDIMAIGLLGGNNINFALLQGNNIVTTGLGIGAGVQFFDSPGAGRLRYIGDRSITVIVDAMAAVSVDDPTATALVGVVEDPTGVPSLLGFEGQGIPGTTTMAISTHAFKAPLVTNDELGIRVQVAAPATAGNVLGAHLRVVEIGQ